jgi:hypothetical protein
MMKMRYDGWQSFRFKGRKFLALIAKDRNVHVFDPSFNTYGCWFGVDSFKKHYTKDGESLNLDNPLTAGKE